MLVTIWRHGEAGHNYASDFVRELTERGRQSLASASEAYLAQLTVRGLVPPELLWHSPLVRTTQTGKILADHFGLSTHVCKGLDLIADLRAPATFLPTSAEHVVLVSHQPFVSDLISYWLDDHNQMPLMPGGYCVIDLTAPTQGGGELKLLVDSIY